MTPPAGWRRLRILVVEDNRDTADSTAQLIELLGHDCRVAYDGVAGLDAAVQWEPDCLLSDIHMPRANGYTLARGVREAGLAGTKLVAISAFADPDHKRLAVEAGFEYQINKPMRLEELREVLAVIEHIKELAERTRGLAERNVALADETKGLLSQVKEELKEVKQDVKELKAELRQLKQGDGPAG